MAKELEELRRSRPKPPVGGDFTLSDCFYFTRRGIESIVEDEVHVNCKKKNKKHLCGLQILSHGS